MKKEDVFFLGFFVGVCAVFIILWIFGTNVRSDTIIVPDVTITITDQGIDTIYDYHK